MTALSKTIVVVGCLLCLGLVWLHGQIEDDEQPKALLWMAGVVMAWVIGLTLVG